MLSEIKWKNLYEHNVTFASVFNLSFPRVDAKILIDHVLNEFSIEQNDNSTKRRLLSVSVNYYPTLFPCKYITPMLLSFSISQSLQSLNPV